jgi:hypothetical protein
MKKRHATENKLSTKINPHVLLALRNVANAENVKICKIVEEGIRLWLAENDRRKRQLDTVEQKQLI